MLATALIVIGAIAAIAAVICTGGTALVPLLTALFTAIGVSAGTAATVATVVSITIATIAVLSTIGSSTLNIIGTWKDMSSSSTFKKWQTALNITCAVSNGIYSLGEIFNLLSTKIGGVTKSVAYGTDDIAKYQYNMIENPGPLADVIDNPAIKIPKGTTTYTGPVGPQGGAYCGGYDKLQTFIQTPWKIDGIEVIDSFPLR